MKLANALSRQSANEKKTLADSSKNTAVRKRLHFAKCSALSSIIGFPSGIMDSNRINFLNTNISDVLAQRWEAVPKGAKRYYQLVGSEYSGMANASLSLKADLTFSFLTFLENLTQQNELPRSQIIFAKKIVALLIEKNFTESVGFKYSVENEILVVKNNRFGNHYLIIGDEQDDLSYGFTGKEIGKYKAIHLDNDNSLEDLVTEFVNA